MPTVTNVNNVSLICGGPPALHGITANYFLNQETGEEVYMESGDFLLSPTLMEAGTAAGRKTAALASKKKLTDMIGKGAGATSAIIRVSVVSSLSRYAGWANSKRFNRSDRNLGGRLHWGTAEEGSIRRSTDRA